MATFMIWQESYEFYQFLVYQLLEWEPKWDYQLNAWVDMDMAAPVTCTRCHITVGSFYFSSSFSNVGVVLVYLTCVVLYYCSSSGSSSLVQCDLTEECKVSIWSNTDGLLMLLYVLLLYMVYSDFSLLLLSPPISKQLHVLLY